MMKLNCLDRTYRNSGNPNLTSMLDEHAETILDVGCGCGDNAALIRKKTPQAKLYGITVSPQEARAAATHFDDVWVCDIEERLPEEVFQIRFDAIIFSHVLEHLRDPAAAVAVASQLLRDDGCMLIAVPNVANWRQRFKFFLGRFEYEENGIMDETHVRFFTFLTADRYLLTPAAQLECVEKRAEGSVPLWVLRRYFFPKQLCAVVDRVGVLLWPNLFGFQVLIKARKLRETKSSAVNPSGSGLIAT